MYKLISSVKTTSKSVDKTSAFPQGGILSPENEAGLWSGDAAVHKHPDTL